MKLSEAIRLGAMMKPQCFHRLYDEITGGSCAFGAALDAVGGKYAEIPIEWFSSGAFHAVCPECDNTQRSDRYAGNTIAHLNDEHWWSRERIADWVHTLEATVLEAESTSMSDAVDVLVESK
jgi:hypothetical protein